MFERGVVHTKGQILPQQGKTKLIRQRAKHTQQAASFLLLHIPTKLRDCIIRRNTGQHKSRSMCHSIPESQACGCANSNMGSRLDVPQVSTSALSAKPLSRNLMPVITTRSSAKVQLKFPIRCWMKDTQCDSRLTTSTYGCRAGAHALMESMLRERLQKIRRRTSKLLTQARSSQLGRSGPGGGGPGGNASIAACIMPPFEITGLLSPFMACLLYLCWWKRKSMTKADSQWGNASLSVCIMRPNRSLLLAVLTSRKHWNFDQ